MTLRPALVCLTAVVLTACGGSDSSGPVAGPPARVTKTAGDNQTADPGQPVAIAPSVTVTDAQGIPVPGIVVTFSIGDGSGTVSNAAPTTDALGVATLGSWTLGALPGASNTLIATVGELEPATFTATATGTNPCSLTTSYTIGTTANGTFSDADCPSSDGSFIDFYRATVSTAGAYVFSESSNAFDTYLLMATADGLLIAENDDISDTDTNSSIKALLPAGSYTIAANTYDPAQTGNYTLSSEPVPTSIENCEQPFVARGVATAQTLVTTDCIVNGFYSDDVLIFLIAGQSVTVSMSSNDFDAYVEIYDRDGLVASNDDKATGSTDAEVTYMPTRTAYYLIAPTTKLTGAPGTTGSYTMVIH